MNLVRLLSKNNQRNFLILIINIKKDLKEYMDSQSKKAYIIVDMQNDFCEGGSLEVKGSLEIIPLINDLRKKINWDLVVLTSDWHPKTHCSFHSNHPESTLFQPILLEKTKVEQVMWPNHCVQNTPGAEFHKDIITENSDVIIRKGTLDDVDSYSGFGTYPEDTGLNQILQKHGIKEVYVVGLAFDYCVGNTALDAIKNGYQTFVLADCTRSVTETSEKIMKEKLEKAGCKFITSNDVKSN